MNFFIIKQFSFKFHLLVLGKVLFYVLKGKLRGVKKWADMG